MIKEKILPISWEGWDQHDTLILGFYDVLFHEEFGDIPADSRFSSVIINYGSGNIECYADDGETLEFSVNFVCKAVTNE